MAERFFGRTREQFFSGGIKKDYILALVYGDDCVNRRVDYSGKLSFIPRQRLEHCLILFFALTPCLFGQLLLGHVDRDALTTNRSSRIVDDGGQLGHDPNRAVILRHPTEIENTLLSRRENLFTFALNSVAIRVVYELETEIRSRQPLLPRITQHPLRRLAYENRSLVVCEGIGAGFPNYSRYVGDYRIVPLVFRLCER